MENMNVKIGTMQTQLAAWGAKLDELAAKAAEAGADALANHHEVMGDLEKKYERANAKLEELKAAGSEKWKDLSAGVESVWDDVDSAFKTLTK